MKYLALFVQNHCVCSLRCVQFNITVLCGLVVTHRAVFIQIEVDTVSYRSCVDLDNEVGRSILNLNQAKKKCYISSVNSSSIFEAFCNAIFAMSRTKAYSYWNYNMYLFSRFLVFPLSGVRCCPQLLHRLIR